MTLSIIALNYLHFTPIFITQRQFVMGSGASSERENALYITSVSHIHDITRQMHIVMKWW